MTVQQAPETLASKRERESIWSHVGKVTEVDATSMVIDSTDGALRHYVLTDNTVVEARVGGTANIAVGTLVRVAATVEDGMVCAVAVNCVSHLHDSQAPGRARLRCVK